MAITEADVRLYASQRMTDNPDGGGGFSSTVIVDGVDNNVWPDVTDIDRIAGRVNARKLFGAVISADTDTYLSAFAMLDDGPDDPAIDGCLGLFGTLGTERAALATALAVAPYTAGTVRGVGYTGGSTTMTTGDAGLGIPAGSLVLFTPTPGLPFLRTLVDAVGTGIGATFTVDQATPGSGALSAQLKVLNPVGGVLRFFGVGTTGALTASGATAITVDRVWARVVPAALTAAYPTVGNPTAWLVDPSYYALSLGQVQVIQSGDLLMLSHTTATAPATVSNGQTVTLPRGNLARIRVIGSTGVVHARFTLGVPPPTGVGCTADLTAGTVTFSDVSGLSQPITIEHRIEQLAGCTDVRVGSGLLTLNVALARDFPSGTKVSSLCQMGDWQARAKTGFSQLAWTSVWSDTLIGSSILAQFNQALNPIVVTNKGCVSERWACIFTSSSSYRLVGEALGEVGTGNTGTDFSPGNPVQGVPYLTIPAAGWGTGWAAGNVFRFNTVGAQSPFWELRSIAPSTPGGTDSVTAALRGYINA